VVQVLREGPALVDITEVEEQVRIGKCDLVRELVPGRLVGRAIPTAATTGSAGRSRWVREVASQSLGECWKSVAFPFDSVTPEDVDRDAPRRPVLKS
jgi:hypothetical protein